MKKSSRVRLTLLAAVALAAGSGCQKTEVRDCVDQDRRIVDDSLCQGQPTNNTGGHFFYWMYGGNSGGRFGDTVVGGSTTPAAGAQAVTRGGFGSSGAGEASS
jgi:hypothetical protein